ncbi:MAG: FAD-dependent oxidoreductase [Bacteroidales bacterium]|nr:FAD-dependent oxidoreductase [Bacteroidales bacterium]
MNSIFNKARNILILFITISCMESCNNPESIIFIEAESFSSKGDWVIDQQAVDIMGSPYLLAHGLGIPVKNAETTIKVPSADNYRVWVRTRDWVAPWGAEGAPGRFQILIEGVPLKTDFGTEGASWHWQDGGSIHLKQGLNKISLHDMTGFEGRCDAIIFTTDQEFMPPDDDKELRDFRHKSLGLSTLPDDAGEFDLVVVGGGMAGCCAAVSAARLGCKVALIQNRPVLGGNNSSEVRVGLSGLIHQEPYPKLGDLVDEIGSIGYWTLWEAKRNPELPRSKNILEVIANNPEKKIHNAGPAGNYGDDKKVSVVENEANIKLFLNTHVLKSEKEGNRIVAVTGKNIVSGKELKFRGKLFADCTGDGNLGYLAGADYKEGREGRNETGEESAPESTDNLVMGTSVQWYAVEEDKASEFPECPWAVQFNEKTCHKVTRGDWDWEAGLTRDQINEVEFIRDYAFRVTYGNWDFLKNKSIDREKFARQKLSWVAYIGGKRESRRLMGDVVLKEQDILNRIVYPDASFTTTWGIDLHYPVKSDEFAGEPFRSVARSKSIDPYPVPYRCLYSRNINNLFMAGRDISVTHVALGTVRVMRTGGMMGEVVGMAASVCKKYNALPRDVYDKYLEDLKKLIADGVPNKEN